MGLEEALLYLSLFTPENIGELAADSKIAKEYLNEMKRTGALLVRKYGSGGGADIDNYYHPLLQCQLARISPQSQKNGIALGYMKEVYDHFNKLSQGKTQEEIIEDSIKDLQNNEYGSILGAIGTGISCLELLNGKRTKNMRKENIW